MDEATKALISAAETLRGVDLDARIHGFGWTEAELERLAVRFEHMADDIRSTPR